MFFFICKNCGELAVYEEEEEEFNAHFNFDLEYEDFEDLCANCAIGIIEEPMQKYLDSLDED